MASARRPRRKEEVRPATRKLRRERMYEEMDELDELDKLDGLVEVRLRHGINFLIYE